MTVADILIVALFLYCDMEWYETNAISVCLLCMDTIYMWGGVYLYNALYFGDTWLPKSKSLFTKGLCKMYCTVPFSSCVKPWPCLPAEKCILISFCSKTILFDKLIAFASLFLSHSLLKQGIHFTSSATRPWFVPISFFSSCGMDAPGSFCCHYTEHLTCHNLSCASVY